MSIILDTRTQSTMKSVQYNGRQDPGGYNGKVDIDPLRGRVYDVMEWDNNWQWNIEMSRKCQWGLRM